MGSAYASSAGSFFESAEVASQWWDSLSSAQQAHFGRLARTSNAYHTPFDYLNLGAMPWKTTDLVLAE